MPTDERVTGGGRGVEERHRRAAREFFRGGEASKERLASAFAAFEREVLEQHAAVLCEECAGRWKHIESRPERHLPTGEWVHWTRADKGYGWSFTPCKAAALRAARPDAGEGE